MPLLLIHTSCGSSGRTVNTAFPLVKEGLVAFSPTSGPMGEALRFELGRKGIASYDTPLVNLFLAQRQLPEEDLPQPQNLESLRLLHDVGSLIVVKTVTGADGNPEKLTVQVFDTLTMNSAEFVWGNARPGPNRKDMNTAAKEVADYIMKGPGG